MLSNLHFCTTISCYLSAELYTSTYISAISKYRLIHLLSFEGKRANQNKSGTSLVLTELCYFTTMLTVTSHRGPVLSLIIHPWVTSLIFSCLDLKTLSRQKTSVSRVMLSCERLKQLTNRNKSYYFQYSMYAMQI